MSTVHDGRQRVHGPHFRRDDPLYARAYELADEGLQEAVIKSILKEEVPGQPNDNYYQNPAAIAVMARIRREQQIAEGRQADLARLRLKNLPEAYADRRAQEEGQKPPAWTECDDDPDWRGPQQHELDTIRTAGELLAVCERYGLQVAYDADQDAISLNRRIRRDSPLAVKIARLRPILVAVLQALAQPAGEYGE